MSRAREVGWYAGPVIECAADAYGFQLEMPAQLPIGEPSVQRVVWEMAIMAGTMNALREEYKVHVDSITRLAGMMGRGEPLPSPFIPVQTGSQRLVDAIRQSTCISNAATAIINSPVPILGEDQAAAQQALEKLQGTNITSITRRYPEKLAELMKGVKGDPARRLLARAYMSRLLRAADNTVKLRDANGDALLIDLKKHLASLGANEAEAAELSTIMCSTVLEAAAFRAALDTLPIPA